MDWFVHSLQRYAVFHGRAARREYGFFLLFYLLISAFLTAIDGITGQLDASTGMGLFSSLFSLAVLLPALGVAVRRLHDTGRSGWWLLLGLVPVLGTAVLLLFALQRGQAGPNAHGPAPPSLR
ncbi:DUF805 domain-containing protein [Aquabacterium sp. OR-4]|uniref:DUF805 domain-containing protein n=1 Tax=Aquabacterium sp. OR-4 TaxID=2978127 RepID=UPI0021B250BC|nr:DUF805 domain-containing protein [Aquabacterium sp. OR-4]MDT7834136.1 DUF805 domain-containing protein [Aquabacterium sp. OR-4]